MKKRIMAIMMLMLHVCIFSSLSMCCSAEGTKSAVGSYAIPNMYSRFLPVRLLIDAIPPPPHLLAVSRMPGSAY